MQAVLAKALEVMVPDIVMVHAKDITGEVFAGDLAVLLNHVEIRDAVVGGISMGAAVLVRFALRDPDRAHGLVLIRPAWLDQPLPEGLQLHLTVADYLGRFGVERGCELFEVAPEYQALRSQFPESAPSVRGQFFEDDAVARRGRLVGIPNDVPIRNWKEVEALLMPALVVGNEPDLVHPLFYAVTWAKYLPSGRLVQGPPSCSTLRSMPGPCARIWRLFSILLALSLGNPGMTSSL
jgi:pimeloyl-ACP methyl ester carboxylesterase